MSDSTGITGWVRGLRRREPDANLGDEVRFHLEMETAALVRAGMSPERAAEEARRRFGGVDRHTEALRDERSGRFLEVIGQDARYALRVARRFPAFTAIVVATLGFAIGANTAIFGVIDAVLLQPLPFANPDDVVILYSQNPDASMPRFSISYADFLDWRAQTRSFTEMTAFAGTSATLIENGEPERLSGLMATSNFFSVLGVRPAIGRLFGPEDERGEASDAVVLTDALWRRRFAADSSVIGRSLQFNNRTRRVIGVLPASFRPFAPNLDVITVFSPSSIPNVDSHAQHMLTGMARLKPGVTLEQAQQDLRAVAARLSELHSNIKGWSTNVFRASDEQTQNVRRPLWILFAAAGLLLLIGCINVANLLITRAASRGREVALRQAIGASRGRLVSQFLVESAILATAGGVLGVIIGAAGTRVITRVAPAGTIPRLEEVSVNASVLGFALLLSMSTALLVGLWPALRTTTPKLAGMLRDGGRTSAGATNAPRMRRTLVVAEVSLAVMLLLCSGLVLQSLRRILGVQPGFQVQNVMTMRLSPTGGYNDTSVIALYRDLTTRLAARPGIEAAAAANTPPLSSGGIETPIRLIGRPTTEAGQLMSSVTAVTPNYFRAAGIPIVRGRDMAWSDPTVLLVSETAAKAFWDGDDPIGKRIAFGTRDTLGLEIVGVVKDSRARGLTTVPKPMIYMSYSGAANIARSMTLVVRGQGDPGTITATTRATLREIDPKLPLFNIQPLKDIVDQSIAQPRLNTLLLGVFAAMAALLAGIGIYGVISFSVTQRTQEIGVRMALGATQREVLGLVVREATVLGAAGVALGLVGAIGATRLIQSWLFGVGRSDPTTIIATALGVIAIALLASLVPARRAMRVDPLLAMRAE
jgi:predicted permease